MKERLSVIVLTVVLGMAFGNAREWNPPFPRTMYFSPAGYYGSARDYFLAKYDLAMPCGGNAEHGDLARATHLQNSNIVIGGTSRQGAWPGSEPSQAFCYHATFLTLSTAIKPGDKEISFNNATGYGFPTRDKSNYAIIGKDDWIQYGSVDGNRFTGVPSSGAFAVDTNHPAGDSVRFPIRMSGFGMLYNLTPLAPKIDGKETWKWFVDNRFRIQDFSAYDAVFYDAFRLKLYREDVEAQCGIDLDANRVDDFDEHGLTWINQQWQEGAEKLLQYEHQRMQELHPVDFACETLNSGTVEEGYVFDYADGMLWEGFMRFAYDWKSMVNTNLKWEKKQQEKGRPNLTMITDYEKETREMGRDTFTRMRYGLTTAILSGAYYGRTFGDWYYIGYYHDEFDANLGYPTSEPQELTSGAWVRFFDHGAAICNPSGKIIQVASTELIGKSGYAGPYYRMRGGQDPNFNNGELFTTVELFGEVRDAKRPRNNQGDGILLFKQPTVVVADIWVGNTYNNDTSPASDPVQLTGEWEEVQDEPDIFPTANNCFSQWSHQPYNGAYHNDGIGYAVASAGNGSSTAVFTPTIGVPGYYEISEWHGKGSSLSSATPFEVVVQGHVKLSGSIDQTKNSGRWNMLGYLSLPQGKSAFLRISNKTNGQVLADAVRFRYLGDHVEPDTTPPNPPQNLKIVE
ncbi:MAG: hypothetical protein EHM72_15985 [Calditrichaeota bacterium]|nr:MAG: hypothetical protein EHM72_15985 [Calditrichota bacterium]